MGHSDYDLCLLSCASFSLTFFDSQQSFDRVRSKLVGMVDGILRARGAPTFDARPYPQTMQGHFAKSILASEVDRDDYEAPHAPPAWLDPPVEEIKRVLNSQ